MQTMVDMELDDEDKVDLMPTCVASEKPVGPMFPYGLRICLSGHELDKLGLDYAGAEIGGMIHGHFMARVTMCSQDKRIDGEVSERVELQIEALSIESEDEENEEAEAAESAPPRRRSLYQKGD